MKRMNWVFLHEYLIYRIYLFYARFEDSDSGAMLRTGLVFFTIVAFEFFIFENTVLALVKALNLVKLSSSLYIKISLAVWAASFIFPYRYFVYNSRFEKNIEIFDNLPKASRRKNSLAVFLYFVLLFFYSIILLILFANIHN